MTQETPILSASPLSGADWLAQRRAELRISMKQAQRERHTAERASREKRSASLKAAYQRRVQAISPSPPTPEEIAKEGAKAEQRRLRRNAYARKRRKQKKAADPEFQRRKQARKMRRYRVSLRKRKAHERFVARIKAAADKRQAKAQRRARRESIAAEKGSVRRAQGLPERKTPFQKRLDEAYIRGLQEGRLFGRQEAYAEIEANDRYGCLPASALRDRSIP